MSQRKFTWFGLVLVLGFAALTAGSGPALNRALADDSQPKNGKDTKKPAGNQNKDKKSKVPNKKPADTQQKKPADANVNRLSLEYKALRALRNLEATPAQISEIARIGKKTAAKPHKRDPAKAANNYVATLTELRDALVKDDEQKIESLQAKLDGLRDKEPPDLDDEIEITDAAELEVQRLLNMLSPQQVVAYADSLGDELPDPVDLIQDGLEEGRELKGAEWESTRDELAEKVSWLVGGLNGENTSKIEEQVTKYLDSKHSAAGKPGDLESEIRKLVGSPGPIVVLNNILEHDLAVLLSNPQLEHATRACLRGQNTQLASAEKPITKAAKQHTSDAPSAPPTAKSGKSNKSDKSGKPAPKPTPADLDEVLKSPDKYEGQFLKFAGVTITGTGQGKQENFLWLAIKTGSGKVVPAQMQGQSLTFVMAKADAPKSLAELKPEMPISATLTCHIIGGAKGKHWNARVRHINVQPQK
jgi:hypothetical protein